jgi:CDP-diacylglycerol--glycerol-3-phosphate 3-phosphatidyltransferase
MFDGNFRPEVEAKLRPVGQQIKKSGITADHLTTLGLVMAIGAAAAIALGSFKLAFLLVILTGIPDLLDGAVAKASGTAGPRGAFFDSVIDRVTDGLLFGAVAVYYSRENPGLVWLPVLVMASASWVSYLRAKAEALGFDARGGLVERAERFILFCFGLLFPFTLVWVLGLMAVLNLVTCGQRFVKVWRQASNTPSSKAASKTRRRSRPRDTTMSQRWAARAEARRRSTEAQPRL